MLINMVLAFRDLPYPASKRITVEMVREIKRIPNDEIRFTETQVAWMHRVLENLKYLIVQATEAKGDIGSLLDRKKEFEEALALHQRQSSEKSETEGETP